MFAIQKNSEDVAQETYCHYCNSWKDNDDWTYYEIVVTDWKEVKVYEDGSNENADGYEIGYKPEEDPLDTWECPGCYSQVRELNCQPRDDLQEWLCGACGNSYSSENYSNAKESAKECCSYIENVQPNPAVFAQLK